MRIYSNTLTASDAEQAIYRARYTHGQDIWNDGPVRQFASRTAGYRTGIEMFAQSVSGRWATGHAPIASGPRDHLARAASWDAYGYVIALLFAKDPAARIGPYRGRDDFIEQVKAEAPRRRSEAAFLSVLDTAGSASRDNDLRIPPIQSGLRTDKLAPWH
jgi:hypothetical protein